MTSELVTVVDNTQAVVAGDDVAIVGTITSNGATLNLTGYTVTASAYDERDQANRLVSAHAVTLTTAASGIVTITLTAAETAALHSHPDTTRSIYHIFDFKCVAGGGAIVHSDPWRIRVRRGITA